MSSQSDSPQSVDQIIATKQRMDARRARLWVAFVLMTAVIVIVVGHQTTKASPLAKAANSRAAGRMVGLTRRVAGTLRQGDQSKRVQDITGQAPTTPPGTEYAYKILLNPHRDAWTGTAPSPNSANRYLAARVPAVWPTSRTTVLFVDDTMTLVIATCDRAEAYKLAPWLDDGVLWDYSSDADD